MHLLIIALFIVMRKFYLDNLNKTVEKQLELYEQNEIIIKNTFFEPQHRRRYTWVTELQNN